jgi:Domain of unknown function (DUF4062)
MQPIKVFLSSTYRDKDLRETARQTIDRLPGFVSILVEESPATMRAPEQVVLDQILKADVFVLVVGTSDSAMVAQDQKTFLQYEYEIAAKAGKPILAFFPAGSRKEREVSGHALHLFAKRLESQRLIAHFDTLENLHQQLTTSLLKLKETRFTPDFEIAFDQELSEQEVKAAFEALADYYRACGGVGLSVEFEHEEAEVREPIHV